MNWKQVATTVVTVASASAATAACEAIMSEYDFEFHLERERPNVSRTWDIDQPIPNEIYEEF